MKSQLQNWKAAANYAPISVLIMCIIDSVDLLLPSENTFPTCAIWEAEKLISELDETKRP